MLLLGYSGNNVADLVAAKLDNPEAIALDLANKTDFLQ